MTLLHQWGGLVGKVPAAQVWRLEFNPQNPGKTSGVQLALVFPMWGEDKKMAGLSGQPAPPPEVSVSEVSLRDSVPEKYDAGGSISSSGNL